MPSPRLANYMVRPSRLLRKADLARRRHGSWRAVMHLVYASMWQDGLVRTVSRVRAYGRPRAAALATALIDQRYARLRADIAGRLAAPTTQSEVTVDSPVISIILPVYRVKPALLERAIQSVRQQTYPRWELCIADDASGDPDITALLQRLAAADSRIKLALLAKNQGIAGASNAALALASGAFVGFLDHDDLLTHDALARIADALTADPTLDVVYSDECKIDDHDVVDDIYCKPDWSPAFMLNAMYIGHLGVYRRVLVTAVGGLRSEYNFSQDYDLALRIMERTSRVHHVESVLYCWRMTAGSAAAGDKPYARTSNIAALQDALNRRGYAAEAVALPTANRARWKREALDALVSIIIPSDDVAQIRESIHSIEALTGYNRYEILIVTRSQLIATLSAQPHSARVRFVSYDRPFNFSDKCNVGAEQASGDYLVFYNDDVRVISEDWIEALLECLSLQGVGAVAPKLLYEDGTIQHAGLVSGVRRLIGTAFHCLPADTSAYFNLAQSVREASSVSGACLAVASDLYRRIGGFDAVNTPIGHSDVDLCFRLWDIGYSSVYTPHATLLHKGHQSLAAFEKRPASGGPWTEKPATKQRDKADIHLLRHWPALVARDPYYTHTMRDLLYADSPERFEIFPSRARRGGGHDILIVSHDLTNSGAPRVVHDMVRVLIADGHFVVVMAPSDGPLRSALVESGATVIAEPLLMKQNDAVLQFARNFDRVIVNTVAALPVALQLARAVPVFWYIHESQYIADEFVHNADFVQALHEVQEVWVVSRRAWRFVNRRCGRARVLEHGVDELPLPAPRRNNAAKQAVFTVIGTFEERKGQDLALAAIGMLPEAIRRDCTFRFFGRVLQPEFHHRLLRRAAMIAEVTIGPELDYIASRAATQETDVLLCPSRDDSFSLVAMEAMAAGKVVVCTATTGVADYIEDGTSGFVAAEATARALAEAMLACLRARDCWDTIGGAARDIHRGHFTVAAFADRMRAALAL